MSTTTTTVTTTTADGGVTTITTTSTTSGPAAPPPAPDAETIVATQWPRAADAITNEWLSALLGGTVTAFEVKTVTSGAMSDMCIVTPTYTGAPGKPSVVLKLTKGLEVARQMALGAGAYKRECEFYTRLAADCPLQTVEVYGVWRDAEKPDEWFCIAMANMNTANQVFDCAKGITWAESTNILMLAAKLHAKYFQSDVLKQDWLSCAGPDGTYHHVWDLWAYGFFADPVGTRASAKRGMAEHAPPTVTNRLYFCPEFYPECSELLDILGGPQGPVITEAMRKKLTSRPYTVVHGDLRCDNIFNPKDGSRDYPVVDWQMVGAGPPAVELVQALCMSIDDVASYERINELVELYHAEFVRCNPKAAELYPLAMCVEDFAISMAFCVCGMTGIIGDYCAGLAPDPENDLWKLVNVMVLRTGACATHAGTLAVVKKIAATL